MGNDVTPSTQGLEPSSFAAPGDRRFVQHILEIPRQTHKSSNVLKEEPKRRARDPPRKRKRNNLSLKLGRISHIFGVANEFQEWNNRRFVLLKH